MFRKATAIPGQATAPFGDASPPHRRNENQTFVSCEGAVFVLRSLKYKNVASRAKREDADCRARRIKMLYVVVSQWIHLTEQEKMLFCCMSEHVAQWVELLAMIHGNDYLEDLASREHGLVVL